MPRVNSNRLNQHVFSTDFERADGAQARTFHVSNTIRIAGYLHRNYTGVICFGNHFKVICRQQLGSIGGNLVKENFVCLYHCGMPRGVLS